MVLFPYISGEIYFLVPCSPDNTFVIFSAGKIEKLLQLCSNTIHYNLGFFIIIDCFEKSPPVAYHVIGNDR